MVSCVQDDYSGGYYDKDKMQETYDAVPSLTEAPFQAMFSQMGQPYLIFPSSGRADDFGYIMAALSQDAEGADLSLQDNDYNWFSTCGEYTSRNADYANPYIRFKVFYITIAAANDIISTFTDPIKVAQAKCVRANAYMQLAKDYQFTYLLAKDKPCVPVLKDGCDYGNNPRASVEEVYSYVVRDLNEALAVLDAPGVAPRATKDQVDANVAYGLRARANLVMGNWADAATDAEKAMRGYTPATIEEVSTPSFCDLAEHNWIWGIDITDDMGQGGTYATPSSWISAFSGSGYAPATTNTPVINKMLYDKISSTDVRKGWWLNAEKTSPLLEGLSWTLLDGVTYQGQAIVDAADGDSKVPYEAYTNVKFGQKAGVGSILNVNDFPLMRVEEMILLKAEALYRAGQKADAESTLSNFVKTYRDPSYVQIHADFLDAVWYQRRIELWGEGFFTFDARRLNKPIVRFHGEGTSNFPDAFQFNIAADDPWLLMRFCTTELNTNAGIVDNTGGEQPVAGQNPELRDGVTD